MLSSRFRFAKPDISQAFSDALPGFSVRTIDFRVHAFSDPSPQNMSAFLWPQFFSSHLFSPAIAYA